MRRKNRNIYFDIDGVLAKWQDVPLEELTSPGYFKNLPAEKHMCKVFNLLLLHKETTFNIFTLSSVFQDNHSIEEKKEWLRNISPWLPEENMIFVPYGTKKSDFIQKPQETDILVDDFTKNLKEWHGIGVKVFNGINGTHGSWNGFSIHSNMNPDILYRQLLGIIDYSIKDEVGDLDV